MKRFLTASAVMACAICMSITAFAGTWQQDDKGYWYVNDDGSYPVNCWLTIDGKEYYFGADGYMLANTVTPDGSSVDATGAKVAAQPVQAAASEQPAVTAVAQAPAQSGSSTADTTSANYILNLNSRKFHTPGCASVKKMNESNKKPFKGSRDEVLSMGYDPCGNCHP